MDGLFSRLLAGVATTVAAGAAGAVGGAMLSLPVSGALAGAAAGALLYGLRDSLRAHRFAEWLRRRHEGSAPRDAGFWGEIGYRVERSVRTLEANVAVEHARLDHFLSAIEASPNGVMLLDANEQIEWCNSVAAEHFGIHPQRDRRQPVTNLVRAPTFVAYLQAGVFDEPVQIAGSGSFGILSVLVRTYGDGQLLLLSQDITERERNDGMRRDFVANVSHEIRTPLTVLTGFIETMSTLPLTEVERTRVLDLMSQQTQRMQTLVGDLLTLAQLEGSPPPTADRWVPVERLLEQVRADAQALSAGRHHFSVTPAQGAQVAGAEAELLSALGNLATNAVRYTPAGGSVDLVWNLRADGAGELEVRDSGIGIAREHIPRLSERFYRVDGSRSRDTGGTGLGLSIVKHVAQRHGGALEFSSEAGKGSRFRLLLPAVRVRVVPASADEAAQAPTVSDERRDAA